MRNDSRELLALGIFGRKSLGDRIEILLKRSRDFSPRASLLRVGMSVFVLLALAIAGARAPRWIAFAQEADQPSFAVASIKPGDPSSQRISLKLPPGGRLVTTNASLEMLIGFAYDVRNHQISGIPKTFDSVRFNIEAVAGAPDPAPGPSGQSKYRLMLQSLLAERVKLTVHRETREEQVYELMVGKGGPKFKETADPSTGSFQGIRGGIAQLDAKAVPMQMLANQFSQRLGRSVIDKTNLTGVYDFALKWAPDPAAPAGPPGRPDAEPVDPYGPSLFTAVQEQLGLKLQSAKGPVDILVIDYVQKFSEN